MASVKEETVHNLKYAGQNVGAAAAEASEDLRTAANQAGRKVRGWINTASDELSHAKDTVTTEIRSNPVQSSMIALGVGFILGALMRR